MPILIDIPKPREWTAGDWKLLPNLRRPQHTDGDNGWQVHPLIWRCPHGVYVTEDPYPFWTGSGGPDGEIFGSWAAPFCEVCYATYAAEWREVWRRLPARRGPHFFKGRKLEAAEYRYQREKLFDGRKVYPETFTRIIKLRGRSLTADLRLQEDPETGKPRLETMGGYVAKAFGYGRAGKGHGPDSDADNIRLSWMAQHEDGPVGHADPDPESTPWSATLPHLREIIGTHPGAPHPVPARDVPFRDFRLITAKNWQPYSFPVLRGPVRTNTTSGLGLKEGEFFGDSRTLFFDRNGNRVFGIVRPVEPHNSLRWWNEYWRVNGEKPVKASTAEKYLTDEEKARDMREWWTGIQPLPPTARELAQWRRNEWNTRKAPANRVPLRRTKHWPDNWREEQRVRTSAGQETVAAKIEMYRYGTREIQVEKMCQTANENYRKARLALAANHGKVGFWRSEKLEGGHRLSVKTGREVLR